MFDENLAARSAREFAHLYPGSAHVSDHGLLGASDRAIWQFAASGDFVLVTKDDDFQRLSVMYDTPPKIVWIRLGNGSTTDVARLLRLRTEKVEQFVRDPDASFLAPG